MMKLTLLCAILALTACSSIEKNQAYYRGKTVDRQVASDSAHFIGEIKARGGESDSYFVDLPGKGRVELWQGSSAIWREIRANVGNFYEFYGEWRTMENGLPAFVVERMEVRD